MGESSSTCLHCRKRIVPERAGWRSDEHGFSVDRVLCEESPEPDVANKRHVPVEALRRLLVQTDEPCECELRTGDLL